MPCAYQHSWMDVPLWLLRACFLYFGWSRTGVWGRCIKCPRLLRPGQMKPFMWGGKGIMSSAVQQFLWYLCAVWVWQAAQISGMISKESQCRHPLQLCSQVKVFWGDVSVLVAGNAFSFLYKCKEQTEKTLTENVFGGVREGCVCLHMWLFHLCWSCMQWKISEVLKYREQP